MLFDKNNYLKSANLTWHPLARNLNLSIHWLTLGYKDKAVFDFARLSDHTNVIKSLDALMSLLYSKDPVQSVIYEEKEKIEKLLRQEDNQNSTLDNLEENDRFAISVMNSEFDADFYSRKNKDININPNKSIIHFHLKGWREHRNPNSEFDVQFYLANNLDVKAANINPFYHFIVAGRSEGRIWHRSSSMALSVIESLRPSRLRLVASPDKLDLMPLAKATSFFKDLAKHFSKFAISISHDNYTKSTGGVQIFVGDEQKKMNEAGYVYIHLAPTTSTAFFLEKADQYFISVTVNGTFICDLPSDRLVRVLGCLSSSTNVGTIHCLLGHDPYLITECLKAVHAKHTLFWLHDYSSLCEGFNLLRNDVEYCGCPQLGSMACRICVYGPARLGHTAKVEFLFSELRPAIISPSSVTLELWSDRVREYSGLVAVVPHVAISWDDARLPRYREWSGNGGDPIVVAFIGYPKLHKGWEIFERIAKECAGDPRYRFVHLCNKAGDVANIKSIFLDVSSEDRNAAVRALAEAAVDIAIVPSIWPETFSFVTYEAAAAGAFVFTTKVSGNVAAAVSSEQIGLVFDTDNALVEHFVAGEAIKFVRKNYLLRDRFGSLNIVGTSASVIDEIEALA